MDLFGKVISLLFNILSRFVRVFLARSKQFLLFFVLNFMAAWTPVGGGGAQSLESTRVLWDLPLGMPLDSPGENQRKISSWLQQRERAIIIITILRYTQRKKESEVAQLWPTLCDPMDCSLSGSSVHGILQARILEWVVISSSRGSSEPRDRTQVSCIAGGRFIVWATREALL